MIGNDIIDLELALIQSNWRRPGFLNKVFTPPEINCITIHDNQELLVWLLWSMKEAAYKAHQRKFSLRRQVNWRSEECTVFNLKESAAEGIVTIADIDYKTYTQISLENLHTIAVGPSHSSFTKEAFQLAPSISRSRLLDRFSEEFGLDRHALSIVKNNAGIPFLSHKNCLLTQAFSLSGHGRFSGFCFPLMNS